MSKCYGQTMPSQKQSMVRQTVVRFRFVLLCLVGIALCCAVAPAFAGGNAETPENLIRKMSKALTNLNYEGQFVHVQNGNIESMSIVHSSDSGGELEYMLSLNGEAREVFRNRSLVTCIWPSSKSVIVSDSKERKILPNIDDSLTNSEAYQLNMGKPDRVAGLDTHVINIKPVDDFRYGYRFWIDAETKMLLRSMLIDNEDNAIEQVMFTHISYPENIPPERFESPDDTIKSYNTQLPKKAIVGSEENRVEFGKLPMGYEEVSETYQSMPINDGPVSHVMLSDGMASVSVYVEYVAKSEQADVALGMSSMGGMNAFTHSLPNALITVVGEVPPATVEAIAMSVQLAE